MKNKKRSPESVNPTPAMAEAGPVLLCTVGASIAILVTNLYFAQSLIAVIASDLGIRPGLSGSVVSASQFGYGLGLFLLVPLADMVENKRLVMICGSLAILGSVGLATTTSASAFLCFAFMTGVFSSAAQILIPYLSHALPPNRKGSILGIVMAGVLMAVMLARPYSLFVESIFGWRTIYIISALATFTLGALLWAVMPERLPVGRVSYLKTLTSMFVLFAGERQVRRRTLSQALIFSVYTMFWATIPILLAERFGLSQAEIALFALVGAGGVLTVFLAGQWADRGSLRFGTLAVSLLLTVALLGSIWATHALMLLSLVIWAILIDGTIQATQTFSRLVVLETAPEHRGRLNALYMTIVYTAGALGSIVGVSIYVAYEWIGVALSASVLVLMAALYILKGNDN